MSYVTQVGRIAEVLGIENRKSIDGLRRVEKQCPPSHETLLPLISDYRARTVLRTSKARSERQDGHALPAMRRHEAEQVLEGWLVFSVDTRWGVLVHGQQAERRRQ